MRVQSGFLLTCALLATAVGIDGVSCARAEVHASLASNSPAQSAEQDNNKPPTSLAGAQDQPGNQSFVAGSTPRTAVVLRFAVESQPVTDTSALSARACSQTGGAAASAGTALPTANPTVDPKILDAISDELQKKLSKKMAVMVNPAPRDIPVGALVISGCITKANGGNATARLVGMDVGASHIGVHVVALSRTNDGWNPVDTFDLQVKGGDILPPLGPVGFGTSCRQGH